jgi:hypothetical protein
MGISRVDMLFIWIDDLWDGIGVHLPVNEYFAMIATKFVGEQNAFAVDDV